MALNAKKEMFDHIELFGKPALFTNFRIDRSTVKKLVLLRLSRLRQRSWQAELCGTAGGRQPRRRCTPAGRTGSERKGLPTCAWANQLSWQPNDVGDVLRGA